MSTKSHMKEHLLLNATFILRSFIWAWLRPAPKERKNKQHGCVFFFFLSPLPLKANRALSGEVLRSGLEVSVLKGIDEVNYLFYDEQITPAHSRAVCRKLQFSVLHPGHATERASAHSSDTYSNDAGLLGCNCGLPL